MTQRLLSTTPEIFTVSEPWVLLHQLYALKKNGINAEYNHHLARQAVKEFIKLFPNGIEDYRSAIRDMCVSLYEKAMGDSPARYFLDKTPRYYYILNELEETFPESKRILLARNPISVLLSIVNTWCRDDLIRIYRYKSDLLLAPKYIVEEINKQSDNVHLLSYEKLLSNTAEQLEHVEQFLGLKTALVKYYGERRSDYWKFGDQKVVYSSTSPEVVRAAAWIEDVRDPQLWRLAKDYVTLLGEDLLDKLGYSLTDIVEKLDERKPSVMAMWKTKPLWFYLQD